MSAAAYSGDDRWLKRTEAAREAAATADRIASTSGVEIRLLSTAAEFAAVEELLCDVWSSPQPQVRASTLRAMVYAGCYVAGVFALNDPLRMLGACIAFFATPDRHELHSHITGVRSEARGKHLGLGLKMHQRAWALERGVDTISWTYDPLVRRNAYFNLVGLEAKAQRYFVDFYGRMDDSVNNGEPSDRLLIEWNLQSPSVVGAANGIQRVRTLRELTNLGAHRLLEADENGVPRVLEPSAASSIALVQTPRSIEEIRHNQHELSLAWRLALRSALAPLMATGSWTITGFTSENEGWYIVEATE